MIHAGTILFEENKDALLEKFRIVKGDVKLLPGIQPFMLIMPFDSIPMICSFCRENISKYS